MDPNGFDRFGMHERAEGSWIFLVLFCLAVVVAVAAAVLLLIRSTGTAPRAGSEPPGQDARRILEMRLARGEIDEDEFRRRLAVLEE